MILAVLEKRGGVQVRQSDVFVNVAGGIAIQDPAIDLGVAVAIAGSVTDVAVPTGMCFIGEVGLTGEVRRAAFAEQRVAEAVRLGLTRIVMPPYGMDGLSSSLRSAVEPAERIADALRVVFG
jgi:DNA repair protein RadA/Sms